MEQNLVNKKIKRVDRWINYFIHHTWVKTMVFVVALLEATISPLLPEIVVAGVLVYRKDISWKILSFVSAIGSTSGVIILYFIGKHLYYTYQSFFDNFFGSTIIGLLKVVKK